MTEEMERRLRSLAANIVDLEQKIAVLQADDLSGAPLEARQRHRCDLMVAEANLREAERQAMWLKLGCEPL